MTKPPKPKPVDNWHLWLCEAGHCKSVACMSYQPSFRLDLYCEKHAAMGYAADLKKYNRKQKQATNTPT